MIEFEGSIKYGANPSGQGGIPRWGKQIQSPGAAALLYTQPAQAAKEPIRKGSRSSRLQPVRTPEDLGHEDLGLEKKQTSRVRGSRACPRAEPIETSSTVVLSYSNYHKLSNINSKRLQLPIIIGYESPATTSPKQFAKPVQRLRCTKHLRSTKRSSRSILGLKTRPRRATCC